MKLISGKSNKGSRAKKRKGFFRKLSAKERLIFLAPALAAIIAVGITTLISESVERYTLPYAGIRYYAGGRFEIPDGSTLRRTSEDETVVEFDGGEYELDSLPIYYDEVNSVFFAENMVYMEPRMNEYGKMDYFTTVEITSDGSVYATRDDDKILLRGGFAFDGEDTYIFFEDIVLQYNGYKMELPAFTYIEAVFTSNVMIYNSGTGEQYMEAPKGDVIVTMSGEDFELSLLEDAIRRDTEGNQLLFTQVEALDSIF